MLFFHDFRDMTPERIERLKAVLNKRQVDLTVVLENVADPHNISAVMRTCDAVGIQDIYILNTAIEKHKKWSTKSSSSASKWLTIHQFDNLENCLKLLRKDFKNIYTTHLANNAGSLYELNLAEPTVLGHLLRSERPASGWRLRSTLPWMRSGSVRPAFPRLRKPWWSDQTGFQALLCGKPSFVLQSSCQYLQFKKIKVHYLR